MSIKAKARMAAEAERQRAREEVERLAEEARITEEQRAEFEAGPPGGCHECYMWRPDWMSLRHFWGHGDQSAKPGPPPPEEVAGYWEDPDESHWCYHECHGGEAPVYCGPIAMAACG